MELAKRLLFPSLIALANAGYLTGCYTTGFFTGRNATTLVNHFTLPILSLPLFFLVLLLVYNLKNKTYSYKGQYALPNRLFIFGFYAVLLLFIGVFGILLFKKATENGGRDLDVVLPVFAEVLGLVWLTTGQKEGRVKRQLLLLALWAGSVLVGFVILGISERLALLHFTNGERLLFSGIFFHATSTGYGLYKLRLRSTNP